MLKLGQIKRYARKLQEAMNMEGQEMKTNHQKQFTVTQKKRR